MDSDIFLSLLHTEPSTVKLVDLKQPSVFDDLRKQIDKEAFYKLEPFYHTDEILQCRRAQLLIDDTALEQAFAILSSFDGLLAEGLMVQALCKTQAWTVVQVYVSPYISWSKEKCLSSSPNEQEGLVHIFEAAYLSALADQNYDYAKFLLERSLFLASNLELAKTLAYLEKAHLALVRLANTSH